LKKEHEELIRAYAWKFYKEFRKWNLSIEYEDVKSELAVVYAEVMNAGASERLENAKPSTYLIKGFRNRYIELKIYLMEERRREKIRNALARELEASNQKLSPERRAEVAAFKEEDDKVLAELRKSEPIEPMPEGERCRLVTKFRKTLRKAELELFDMLDVNSHDEFHRSYGELDFKLGDSVRKRLCNIPMQKDVTLYNFFWELDELRRRFREFLLDKQHRIKQSPEETYDRISDSVRELQRQQKKITLPHVAQEANISLRKLKELKKNDSDIARLLRKAKK